MLLVAFLVFPLLQIFMRLLNRTTLVGKRNLKGLEGSWILMSNHVTLLDDLFLDALIFFPSALRGYRYIPFHAPEERNFYGVPIIAWFMRSTKSIPLMRGRGLNQEGNIRLIEAVRDRGRLHIYPEGTRTRTGEIGPAKVGIGKLVYESGGAVVPMYHQGLQHILPIGAGFPRFFERVIACIGEPITFDEERKLPNTPETWRLITHRIMDAIRNEQVHMAELFPKDYARIRSRMVPSAPPVSASPPPQHEDD